MSFPFLSDPWIERCRAMREELYPAVHHLGVDIRMNVSMTDCPLDDAPTDIFVEMSADKALFEVGRLPDADVDLTVSYTLAKEILMSGNMDRPLHEIMTGGIHVDGDFWKLLQFGGVMATDGAGVTAEIGRRLSEFTD